MEKMLQSLLRLHCLTFLEKTYLRNSALNPGTVGRQGRVPAWLCGPVAGPSKHSQGDSIPDFQTGIFFLQKWPFLSAAECSVQERTLLLHSTLIVV